MNAAQVADWISGLTITQGPRAGQKWEVMPWQHRLLDLLEVEDSVGLTMGRGGGKSSTCGALSACATMGPLRQRNAETVVVASSAPQAAIVWEHAFRLMFPDGAPDRRIWRYSNNHVRKEIVHKPTGSSLRCLSSDPRRAHGIAPVMAIIDEPAQHPPTTTERMKNAISTSLGKVENAKLIAIGTRPSSPEHWFSKLLSGPGGITYAAHDLECDLEDESAWLEGNPSLPYMPVLEAAIRREARAAKSDRMLAQAFRSLRLNQGVAEEVTEFVVDPQDWSAIEVDESPPRAGPLYVAIDLSGGAAMAAAVGVWPKTGAVDAFGVFPRRPSLRARGSEDNVGSLYEEMHQRGELLLLGERVPDVGMMLDEIVRRWGVPVAGASDGYKRRELLEGAERVGFRPTNWSFRKGGQHWGEDVRALRAAVMEHKIAPPKSLLLRQGLSEARLHLDGRGNPRLAVRTQSGRRDRARDDVVVAMCMAVSLATKQKSQPQRRRGRVLV